MADAARIAVALALLGPIGFLLGMPFPLGLKALGDRAPALVPWAWGINACASVVSASLATFIALHIGFTPVLGCALVLYVLAAAVRAAGPRPRTPEKPAMKFLVLQHIDIEHPGIFRDFMRADGIAWDTVELDEGEAIPPLDGLRRADLHGRADGRVRGGRAPLARRREGGDPRGGGGARHALPRRLPRPPTARRCAGRPGGDDARARGRHHDRSISPRPGAPTRCWPGSIRP